MKERAAELKEETNRGLGGKKKAAEELDVLSRIEQMGAADRAVAERLHAIVTAHAPRAVAEVRAT